MNPHLIISPYVYLDFAIDTNRINARLKDAEMNQLEKWQKAGVIQIEIPQAAAEECGRGHGGKERAQKASDYVVSLTAVDKDPELQKIFPDWGNDQHMQDLYSKIETILFPSGAKTDNERNDVRVVLGAAYYDCILITNDGDSKAQPGGILGRRQELAKINVTVMRADEAVQKVREKIMLRDAQILQASGFGAQIPEWYGKD